MNNPIKSDSPDGAVVLPRFVLAVFRQFSQLRRIRFGMSNWDHRFRWVYLPWQWARRKSNHGGWFFLTWRTPVEMVVGVEAFARWQNRRASRSQNTTMSGPMPPK